jgi:multicomponent Na+:H+ antiporter subunit E
MRIFSAIALFALWLVLTASYDLIYVVMGAVTATIIVWINPKVTPSTRKFYWLSAIGYMPWLFGRVVKSGFHVSTLILHPALPIKPELLHHKTNLRRDGELVVLGNSITLTPGTITVEVAPGKLVVHAIDAPSQEDLLRGVLDDKVGRLFPTKERDQ